MELEKAGGRSPFWNRTDTFTDEIGNELSSQIDNHKVIKGIGNRNSKNSLKKMVIDSEGNKTKNGCNQLIISHL